MRKPFRTLLLVIAVGALGLSLAAPAAAEAAYGAIAINPKTGAAGISYGYPTQKSAKRRAKRECQGKCEIAVWVRNQCGAVVATRRRYVSGYGPTKKKALKHARKRAHNQNAPRVAWVCSG